MPCRKFRVHFADGAIENLIDYSMYISALDVCPGLDAAELTAWVVLQKRGVALQKKKR